MSLELFKHKFGSYLQKFPINLQFRVQLVQKNFLFNKDYFYFGSSMGQMRHGVYGICFKIESNGNLIVYEGSWQKDQYNGKGSLFLISTPKYNEPQFFRWTVGNWKNSKLQGKGCIKQYNYGKQQWQIKYEGDFSQNYKHGKGIQYFNGNQYQGNFMNGCRHGHGRLTDDIGNFYDGNFFQGFSRGQGLQLKGGGIAVRDKRQRYRSFDKPQKQQQPDFIAKTIRNI